MSSWRAARRIDRREEECYTDPKPARKRKEGDAAVKMRHRAACSFRAVWFLLALLLLPGCAGRLPDIQADPGGAERPEEVPSSDAAAGSPLPVSDPFPAAEETPLPEDAEEAQDIPASEPPARPTAGDIAPEELVRVRDWIPDVWVELRYAGPDNFTGQQIYDFTDAWLRYGTVQRLIPVQEALRAQGLSLLIWDAFRPQAAQYVLWEAYPNGNYVADPRHGHSNHSNGGTLDCALVSEDGSPVPLPSDFDCFDAAADRDYADVPPDAAANALLLEGLMTQNGFLPYAKEWWHFTDRDPYTFDDVEDVRLPAGDGLLCPDCEEFIHLRLAPDYGAEAIAEIPLGAGMEAISYRNGFIRVRWEGQEGYVAAAWTREPTEEERGSL